MFQFLWLALRGYRLRPWNSPYLRWRIETFSGLPAESLRASSFLHFAWRERFALLEYLRWVRRHRYLLNR
jgi:hypothetical protein